MTVTGPSADSGTSDAAVDPRTRRRALWVAAASLTLLAGLAGAVALARSAAPPSTAAPSGTPTASPLGAVGASMWDIPTQAPADLGWTRVAMPRLDTWIPVSPGYGPTTTGVGEWTGWSQTPMGAVMAAHTICAGWGLDNEDAAAYAAAHMQTFSDYVAQSLAQRPADGLAPQVTLRPTGFRVEDYTVAAATVTLADIATMPGTAPTPSMLTVSLQWVDGDWQVRHTPEDHPRRSSTPPSGPFVPWGPQ